MSISATTGTGDTVLDLSTCDAIFLSFDEPNADVHYKRVLELLPHAKRVHGVEGFDAAHRQAGEVASSDHVITIDADNLLVDDRFFTGRFDVSPRDRGAVFSFSARNVLNALEYGNGGVKIWPRETLTTLRSHENAQRREAAVDFCWTTPYFQINRVLSEVHMTATPFQAFRGGFREGVKFNLAGGILAYEAWPDLPKSEALLRHIGAANHERLRVWCSVGLDTPNGDWAILGARLGCVMTALEDFDHIHVADYAWIETFWRQEVFPKWNDADTRRDTVAELGARLNAELALEIADLNAEASRFIKSTYRLQRAFGMTMTV
ncbi:MAG: hypothetical protein RDA78_15860 [Roseibium sp.]|uniref:hypothetical protein n=1 Tax=Roseibium sp. TaxID=1936156 RepID=UPI003D9C640C